MNGDISSNEVVTSNKMFLTCFTRFDNQILSFLIICVQSCKFWTGINLKRQIWTHLLHPFILHVHILHNYTLYTGLVLGFKYKSLSILRWLSFGALVSHSLHKSTVYIISLARFKDVHSDHAGCERQFTWDDQDFVCGTMFSGVWWRTIFRTVHNRKKHALYRECGYNMYIYTHE